MQYLNLKKDHLGVNNYTSSLAHYSRRILESNKAQLISLREELENLQNYLEIEKIRHTRLKIEYLEQIGTDVDIDKEQAPPMILQPICENIIKYTLLKSSVNSIPIFLTIKALKEGYSLALTDYGPGFEFTEKIGRSIAAKGTATGLNNVLNRIQLFNEIERGEATVEVYDFKAEDKKHPKGVEVIFTFRNLI